MSGRVLTGGVSGSVLRADDVFVSSPRSTLVVRLRTGAKRDKRAVRADGNWYVLLAVSVG